MLIAGTGGHAKDIVTAGSESSDYIFFDDITDPPPETFLGKYRVLHTVEELKEHFEKDARFVVGVGGTMARKEIFDKLQGAGGEAINFIAEELVQGKLDIDLGAGLNIMPYTFISNSVKVEDGTLLNTKSSLHHDVKVGKFCDIAPGAVLLGGAKVSHYTFMGANATVLSDIEIGKNCIIGAGAVVTKNVPDNSVFAGVPAKKIRELKPLD